ncbi:MAG: T9SS type A sorting domain-containing protein, partial [Bacteroidia bacterium]|nr:T9SS type A sorting domain-containing protein [Bacteroidia bacterium]
IPLSLTSTTLDILVTLVAGTNSIKLTQSSKWPRVLGIQLIPVHIYISSGNFSDIGITEDQLANTTLTVSSGEFVIDATKTVMSLTIAPGAKLTLSSGSLTATNGITLQSDATGTATFVDANNTAPQAVSGTVQQYLGSATARNWYITPPVTGASVPSGQTYFSYDETGSNTDFSASGTAYWKPEAATSSLDSRKGYIVQTTGITTLNFSGTLNTGTQTPLTLTRTNSVSKPGFNLVANPYPSYLDWKLVSAENTGLLTTAWFRTKNNSGGYIFATVNVATPSSPVIVAVDPNTTITTKIPPMQAYWVRVNAVGSTTYTVNNLMRSHADNTGNKFKAPASAQIKQPLLRLQVSNGTDADETVVLFNANATNGMDMFDSPKMSNNSASIPEIYTQVGNENLVINGMKEITYNTEIPIGFSTLTANDFSISANEVANFEAGTKVILIDKLNPTVETDRFSLLFRAPGTVTSAKNITKMNAQVFVNAANQITIIAPPKTTYSIFNAMGQKQNGNILGSSKTTIENAFGAGVYFVELTVNGRREIQKVVIR